jgi:hypothetical protein
MTLAALRQGPQQRNMAARCALASQWTRARAPELRNVAMRSAALLASQWVKAQGPQHRNVAMRLAALWRPSGPGHEAYSTEKLQCVLPRLRVALGHAARPATRQRGDAIGRALASQWVRAQGPQHRNLAM